MLSKPLLKDFLIECKNPGPEDQVFCLEIKIFFPINTKYYAFFFTALRTPPAGWKRCLLFELITFALFWHPDGFLFIFYLFIFLTLAKKKVPGNNFLLFSFT